MRQTYVCKVKIVWNHHETANIPEYCYQIQTKYNNGLVVRMPKTKTATVTLLTPYGLPKDELTYERDEKEYTN